MPNNNQSVNFTRTLSATSPLNNYHNSLRKLKNDERYCYRTNSLKRSFKKINNETTFNHQTTPHHCTIQLKTKATSCLHLFNKNTPIILTTFKNHKQSDINDQKRTNEFLWHYQLSQCNLNKKFKTSSQCNLNILHHNYHHQCHHQQSLDNNSNNKNNLNPTIAETKFNNSPENKTTL